MNLHEEWLHAAVFWHLHFKAISENEASKHPYQLFPRSLSLIFSCQLWPVFVPPLTIKAVRELFGKSKRSFVWSLQLQVSVNRKKVDPPRSHFLPLKKCDFSKSLSQQDRCDWDCLWGCGQHAWQGSIYAAFTVEDRGCLAWCKARWCQVSTPKSGSKFEAAEYVQAESAPHIMLPQSLSSAASRATGVLQPDLLCH